MNNKLKRLVCIILALVLLISLVTTAIIVMVQSASAATSSEIQSQIDDLKYRAAQLEDEKAALAARLEQTRQQQQDTAAQKTAMDGQIELTRQEIENTTELVRQYTLLISSKQEELDGIIAQEAEQAGDFAVRLRAMEETSELNYLGVLFNAGSFSELLSNLEMIREISESDNKMIDALTATRERITVAQAALEDDKAEQRAAQTLLETQEATLQTQVDEATRLLKQLENDVQALAAAELAVAEEEERVAADIDDKVAEYETVYAQEQAEIKRQEAIRAAAAAAAAAGNTFTYTDDGSWQWPSPGVYGISSVFGMRTHPITGVYKLHTGCDVAAGYGSSILAARGGTVITAGSNYAYGNYVVIAHGNGLTTLYAHMSAFACSQGDYVLQGQTIGYVGSSGYSTGAHLHFEIRVNGAYTDPLAYYGGVSFYYV